MARHRLGTRQAEKASYVECTRFVLRMVAFYRCLYSCIQFVVVPLLSLALDKRDGYEWGG